MSTKQQLQKRIAKKVKRNQRSKHLAFVIRRAKEQERARLEKKFSSTPEGMLKDFTSTVMDLASKHGILSSELSTFKAVINCLRSQNQYSELSDTAFANYSAKLADIADKLKKLTAICVSKDADGIEVTLAKIIDNQTLVYDVLTEIVEARSDASSLAAALKAVKEGNATEKQFTSLIGDESMLDFGDAKEQDKSEQTLDPVDAEVEVDVPVEQTEAILEACGVSVTTDSN